MLPESYILNDFTYFINLLFIEPIKQRFFDKRYEETYTGDGVLFDINDYIYAFNSNENKTVDAQQTVQYTLPKTKKDITLKLEAHTYAIINEADGAISIDMCNLRLDTDAVCNGLENEDQFMREYAAGGKRSDPKNFRETVIELEGFEEKPTVTADGTNTARLKEEWNSAKGILTLTVISNGQVRMTVK